ncbi:MAG: hypothetical protein RIA69_14100, partial [Cyclobacteriaceae bacterium]
MNDSTGIKKLNELLCTIIQDPTDTLPILQQLSDLDFLKTSSLKQFVLCEEVVSEIKRGRTKTNAILIVSIKNNTSETQIWKAMKKYEDYLMG